MKRLQAVSEITASVLTLLIVVSTCSGLYLYLYSNVALYQHSMSQELLTEETRAKQQLSILLVHGNSTSQTIDIVVSSGSTEVKINAIYVNNVLASSETIIIKPLTSTVITVKSPITLNPGDIITVKIVYAEGYYCVQASGKVV